MTLQQLVEVLYMFYHKPTVIGLELPTRRTKKGKLMPNYELPNDEIDTITIKTQNAAGTTEPVPTGDVFSVTSSKPASLGTAVVIPPLFLRRSCKYRRGSRSPCLTRPD
jgi:hypothetical protein